MPKNYEKYEAVKEGDLCYVCRFAFQKYDQLAWLDAEGTKPCHIKCAMIMREGKVN